MIEWEIGQTHIKVLDPDIKFDRERQVHCNLPDWSFMGCCEFIRYKPVLNFQVKIPTEVIDWYWIEKFRSFGFVLEPVAEEVLEIKRNWYKITVGSVKDDKGIWLEDAGNNKLLLITEGTHRGLTHWITSPKFLYEDNVKIPVTIFEIHASCALSALAHNTILRYMWEENGKSIIDLVKKLDPHVGFIEALFIAHFKKIPRYGSIIAPKCIASADQFTLGMSKIIKGEAENIYSAVTHSTIGLYYEEMRNLVNELVIELDQGQTNPSLLKHALSTWTGIKKLDLKRRLDSSKYS